MLSRVLKSVSLLLALGGVVSIPLALSAQDAAKLLLHRRDAVRVGVESVIETVARRGAPIAFRIGSTADILPTRGISSGHDG